MLNPFSKEYKETVKKLIDERKAKKNSEVRILDVDEAATIETGIFGDQVQIVASDGILDRRFKLFNYPLDKVKLGAIDDTHIFLWIEGVRLGKTFFFPKEQREVFERLADALPSDIWYRDQTAMTHVATYKNVNDANKEAMLASKKGWMPQGSSTTDGNFNVGAGLGAAFLLGPIGLLAAANKTGGKITITYVRTSEWMAVHK